jgi:hypothetical protein
MKTKLDLLKDEQDNQPTNEIFATIGLPEIVENLSKE